MYHHHGLGGRSFAPHGEGQGGVTEAVVRLCPRCAVGHDELDTAFICGGTGLTNRSDKRVGDVVEKAQGGVLEEGSYPPYRL